MPKIYGTKKLVATFMSCSCTNNLPTQELWKDLQEKVIPLCITWKHFKNMSQVLKSTNWKKFKMTNSIQTKSPGNWFAKKNKKFTINFSWRKGLSGPEVAVLQPGDQKKALTKQCIPARKQWVLTTTVNVTVGEESTRFQWKKHFSNVRKQRH